MQYQGTHQTLKQYIWRGTKYPLSHTAPTERSQSVCRCMIICTLPIRIPISRNPLDQVAKTCRRANITLMPCHISNPVSLSYIERPQNTIPSLWYRDIKIQQSPARQSIEIYTAHIPIVPVVCHFGHFVWQSGLGEHSPSGNLTSVPLVLGTVLPSSWLPAQFSLG